MIHESKHPSYDTSTCALFRAVAKGGYQFINNYTYRFSQRENPRDFEERKLLTYSPAFAKEELNKIKNAIFQRAWEISRKGGPKSYEEQCKGHKGGVDRKSSSMNTFINEAVASELLSIGKIGVYIDAPRKTKDVPISESTYTTPYLYTFKYEDIRNWSYDENHELNVLLLQSHVLTYDANGLPNGETVVYRLYRRKDKTVTVEYYNSEGRSCDVSGNTEKATKETLEISKIPFVIFEISQSLLTDAASYQVSLLNLASTDMQYALKSNIPFYIEQYNRADQTNYKPQITPSGDGVIDGAVVMRQDNRQHQDQTVKVGVVQGRRYPKDVNPPAFIAPPADPLRVSMEKQKELKEDLKILVHNALANVTSASVSLDSQDQRHDLEAGLNNIGMELQHGEIQIAEIWKEYDPSEEPVLIVYPRNYSLKTDEQRQQEAKALDELKMAIPSRTFQKEVGKQVAHVLLADRVSEETMKKIDKEIEEAATMTSDAKEIALDHEQGLVGDETASLARGYPKGEVEKARKDHAERIKRIQESQTSQKGVLTNPASRGAPDIDPNTKTGSDEKKKASIGDLGLEEDDTRGEADE